eukprot:966040-Pelagomonas_calceolata.AAC.7
MLALGQEHAMANLSLQGAAAATAALLSKVGSDTSPGRPAEQGWVLRNALLTAATLVASVRALQTTEDGDATSRKIDQSMLGLLYGAAEPGQDGGPKHGAVCGGESSTAHEALSATKSCPEYYSTCMSTGRARGQLKQAMCLYLRKIEKLLSNAFETWSATADERWLTRTNAQGKLPMQHKTGISP